MPEQTPLADFRQKFRLDDLTVLESDHWVLSVRPDQLTLGAMVLSVRDGALTFSELTAQVGADLARMLGAAEQAAKSVWGAVRINAIALMMKDPIVHFHVLPRYAAQVDAYGLTWLDEDWPGPPVFKSAPTEDKILQAIAKDLLAAL